MKHFSSKIMSLLALAVLLILLSSNQASAHCDGLDGPVIKSARKALETGNVNPVLIWVQKEDQELIISAFNKTLAIRKLSPETREFADNYFFETLVRIHRAGEGAPYTGLKSAGRDLGPAIPAADNALESGSPKELLKLLQDALHDGLHPKFVNTLQKKKFNPGDIEAGREYVKFYVEYIHFVEKIYQLTSGAAHDAEVSDAHSH